MLPLFKKASLFFTQVLWTLPFLTFISGYFCLQFFMADSNIQAPDLVGKDILHATKICSEQKLNLRIIAEKEVSDAKAGMIIKQNPVPNASIKTYQSIFIVITKLPAPIIAPACIGKKHEEIEKTCKNKHIKPRFYFLPSSWPAGQCFAQMPSENCELEDKKISCYISTGNQNQYIFPDFTNQKLDDVADFLQQHQINFEVYDKDKKINAPYKRSCIVSYQKPLAGTFINSHHQLQVQLQVV